MKYWRVERNGRLLGGLLAESLAMKGDTLVAKRGGRIIGSVASGAGLAWKEEVKF